MLDGFSGAGMFARLRRPESPTELIDSRGLEEFLGSEDWTIVASRSLVSRALEEAESRVKARSGSFADSVLEQLLSRAQRFVEAAIESGLRHKV